MRVYIACQDRGQGRALRAFLQLHDHFVTSSWLDREKPRTDEEKREEAGENEYDIENSDALILVSGPSPCKGAKFVEAGIAFGLGIPVFILGRVENVVMYSGVSFSDQWELLHGIRDFVS